MKTRLTITSGLAALLLSGACTSTGEEMDSSTDPTPILDGRGGGVIAFYSERDGNAEIYVMNADGTAQTRITINGAQDVAPDISPDGSRIAFASNRDGYFDIYTTGVDGANTVRLTHDPAEDAYPSWSPDGTRIIFSSKRGGGEFDLYTMSADGTNLVRVTNTADGEEWAHLSPDARKVVFAAGAFPDYDIYLMNLDGSGKEPLVVLPGSQTLPKWSRDGETIAFNNAVFASGALSGDIYVIGVDGTGLTKVTESHGAFVNEDPYWSPNGTRLVFQSNRSGNFQIYVTNADGSGQRRLTNHPGDDYWPSWGGREESNVNPRR
jgi:Tol biopolymer transport system component